MTNLKDRIVHDIKLVGNVLYVRAEAIEASFTHLNVPLYEAATTGDDAAIVEGLQGVIEELTAQRDARELKLRDAASLFDHITSIAETAVLSERINFLHHLHEHAVANVALITSGEVCYPPATRSTVELMAMMAQLDKDLKAAADDDEVSEDVTKEEVAQP